MDVQPGTGNHPSSPLFNPIPLFLSDSEVVPSNPPRTEMGFDEFDVMDVDDPDEVARDATRYLEGTVSSHYSLSRDHFSDNSI